MEWYTGIPGISDLWFWVLCSRGAGLSCFCMLLTLQRRGESGMGRYVRLDVTYSGVKHDHMSLLILHTCSMTTLAPPSPSHSTHCLPTSFDSSCSLSSFPLCLSRFWICARVRPEKRTVILRLNFGTHDEEGRTPGTVRRKKVCCSMHSFQMRLAHWDSVASNLCFLISQCSRSSSGW